MSDTWTAEDLHRPRSRRLVWFVVPLLLVGAAAGLFLTTSPPRATSELREPGTFGALTDVDLLPGYELDEARARLGAARAALSDGRRVFVPGGTPYSGERPCGALRLPERDDPGACHVFVWLGEDGRSVEWLTFTRPGGPGEALLTGRLLAASDERFVLADGTSVVPGPAVRLSECGDRDLRGVVGGSVVLTMDDATGQVVRVTCRA